MKVLEQSNKEMLMRVPMLRFPEFLEGKEWQEKQLHSVCQMKAGKFISASKINTQYIEGLYPCYGGNGLRGFTSEYSHSGEYSLIGRQGALCGNVNFVTGRFYATEHAVVVSPNKKINNNWLFYYLNKLNLNQYAIGQAQPGLSVNFLEKITIQIPEQEKEQQKIADCLSSLDNVISLQTQKIDTLQQYKKGLMQKLFPAEGETVPELRFSEFRQQGEWEQRKLGEIAKFTSGGTPSKNVADYWNGTIPWISASSMYSTKLNKSTLNVTSLAIGNGTRIAKKGSLLILVRGSMLFNRIPMGIADIDVAFNQDVKSLSIDKKMNAIFLLNQLMTFESRIAINETGIGAGKIETEDLKRLNIYMPSISEQQKIADCLSSLDELIDAETQKLAALKTHKTGLMQQLFPIMDEINR